jgi:hypothetical protein
MLIRRKGRSSPSKQKKLAQPRIERLEDRTLLSTTTSWNNFGGNAQHTGISTVAAQPIDAIHWEASIDLNTQSGIPTHYGEPVFTPNNTAIVPVKTGAAGGFELQAYNGATGTLLWTITTDYQEPPYSWLPPFQAVYSSVNNRVYFAGNGGTVYYINNPDSPGATISGQVAFYGTSNYQANPSAYNSSVEIDTPLTVDNNGNVYFGFMVTGSNPSGLTGGGIGRVSATGSGTYALAAAAVGGNDSTISRVALGSAPAISNDGSVVYVAVNGTGFNGEDDAYLLGLNSTTLATEYNSGMLLDPRSTSLSDGVIDESTAAPMVAPDGTVFFGTFGNLNNYNGSRGFLLHFSANLSQEYTPGAFGWDDTVSIIPASMVPSYTGTSTYLILAKYNNYVAGETGSSGGNGVNEIAILDPYATEPDPNNDAIPPTGTSDPSLLVMKQIETVTSPTPDPDWINNGYPDAVNEWCTNGTAVDPATDSVFINNEDGYAYRWNLSTNTLTQAIQISPGISEPYTATSIGPDGTVYAINGGNLFALGGLPNYTLNNVASQTPSNFGQPVTFTTTLASTDGGATPTGSVTYMDGSTVLATESLINGVATFTTSSLSIAHHKIQAVYSGDGNYTSGSTTLVEPILDETSTGLTSTANPSEFGQSVTFTATVTPNFSTTFVPIGNVTFMDGTTVLGTVALTSADQASFSTSALTGGNHSITAVYSGDLNFAGSTSSAVNQSVTQNDTYTSVVSSANPSNFGQSVTFTATISSDPPLSVAPTGMIVFMDGSTVLGSESVSNSSAAFTTSALAAGSHTITAMYVGDANYSGSTSAPLTQSVNQQTSTTTVVSSSNPSVFGQNVVFTATVTSNPAGSGPPTGMVTFLDGTTVLATETLSGGTATFGTSSLSVGGHSITVSYAGDSNFSGSTSAVLSQTVNQDGSTTTIGSSVNPSVYGQSVTFTATVSANSPGAGTPTGSVTFLDGSTVLATESLSGGVATFSTSSLSVGGHSITASYGSDTNFSGSTSTAVSQTVNKDGSTTTIGSSVNPSVYGQSVTFTATVSANSPGAGTPTGSVTFLDGSTVLATESLSGGVATFSTSSLSVGGHSITASYGSDTNFSGSTSTAVSQTVNQDGTTSSVTSSLNPSNSGQSVTFTATVSANSPGSGTPSGMVTFLDGTTVLGTQTLSGGTATLSTSSLSVGNHSITVSYAGDGNFTGGTSTALTQTVNSTLPGTNTTVTSSANPSLYMQWVTFSATVRAVSGNVKPTGSVTFLDGTTVLATETLSNGNASYMVKTLAVGVNDITVSYSGSSTFSGSTSPVLAQTVNEDGTVTTVIGSPNSSVFGQNVTFTATVKPVSPGSGTPTGMVTFYNGTTVLGTGTLSNSRATLVVSNLNLGTNSITVSYASDGNYSSSTSAVLSYSVGQDNTTTKVATSGNNSVFGQSVTFTATVTAKSPGSGSPTGQVSFLDGTTVLATETLSGGTATFTTSSLSVGSHSITVSYGGDTDFGSSTSSTLKQTVNQDGTTSTVTSSLNPSMVGQSVTFTATVVAKLPGAGLPTGMVTFKNGNTVLGTGMLNGSGQATFTTSSLTVGNHSITVVYAGDTNFKTSTSSALTQQVTNNAVLVELPIEFVPPSSNSANAALLSTTPSPVTTDLALALVSGSTSSGNLNSVTGGTPANATVVDQLFASMSEDAPQGGSSNSTKTVS